MTPFAARPAQLEKPVVLDLNAIPAGQDVLVTYPVTKDVLVMGLDTAWRTGRTEVRGGRRVHWLGGAYRRPLVSRGCECVTMEGIVTDFSDEGNPDRFSDAIVPVPSRKTLKPRIYILGCGTFNIDGYNDGPHGDALFIPKNHTGVWDCRAPDMLIVEQVSITTGYQGLFLPVQHSTEDGSKPDYGPMPSRVSIQKVDMRKTRSRAMLSLTDAAGGAVGFMWITEPNGTATMGDGVYTKVFRDIYLEPDEGETLLDVLGPNGKWDRVNVNGEKVPCAPILATDGMSATWDARLKINGSVKRGRPPGGSYVPQVDGATGGLGIAGRGYRPLDQSRIIAA